MDPKQAQTVTTVVMLTFLLVGGFYVKDKMRPSSLRTWLKFMLGLHLLRAYLWAKMLFSTCATHPVCPCHHQQLSKQPENRHFSSNAKH
eukprot:1156964-Pelagomonas_calceolata.AAC.3